MKVATSRVTAQGQISVPAGIRQKLGLSAGSVIEWHQKGEYIVVKRSGKYTFDDVRRALFPDGPPRPISIEEMDEAIRKQVRKRYARR